MKITVIIKYCFFLWLSLSRQVISQLRVGRLSISPPHPYVNGTVTLRGEAFGFDPSAHEFVWQRYVESILLDVVADNRTSIIPVQQVPGLTGAYSQSVTIGPVKESDEGVYLCIVIESKTGINIAQVQDELFVNYLEEFPVCFPDGATQVAEGDILSCKTVSETRRPEVRATYNQGVILNWDTASLNGTELGSELIHYVTSGEDGSTFICLSISSESRRILSCKIGPLAVIAPADDHQTTADGLPYICPETGLSVASVVCIALAVIVIVATIVIDILFCQYNPRRWKQLLRICSREETTGMKNRPTSALPSETGKRHLYECTIKTSDAQNTVDGLEERQSCIYDSVSLELEASLKSKDVNTTQSLKQEDTPMITSPRLKSTRQSANQSEDVSTVPPKELDYEWPSTARKTAAAGERGSQPASIQPIGAYMDLNLSEKKTDVYTELKR